MSIEPHDDQIMGDDEFLSKTQLKNQAKDLQAFGKELLAMPVEKFKQLPLTENTLNALLDFEKQSGNIARRRHLAYIGKCLRHDDIDAIEAARNEENFNQLREQAEQKKNPLESLINELLKEGDEKIQQVFQLHPQLDRQNLRQLVRNARGAKTPAKKLAATAKLRTFCQINKLAN